jgi:hypothetical protein
MHSTWLSCELSDGMFPDEYAVECRSAENSIVSFFVPNILVDSARSLVQVTELECDDDYCLIFLPATPLEDINRTIKVNRSLVVAA